MAGLMFDGSSFVAGGLPAAGVGGLEFEDGGFGLGDLGLVVSGFRCQGDARRSFLRRLVWGFLLGRLASRPQNLSLSGTSSCKFGHDSCQQLV